MSTIDEVMKKAQEQANNLPAPVAFPAAPPAVSQTSYNMDLDSFLNRGGMEVEGYIQVKDAGIRLHKDWSGYIDEFDVTIDLSEVITFIGIRKEVGKQVTYAKTYDGRTTTRGENFSEIVAKFKAESQKPADPYPGFDIPMTLTKDYADPKDPKKVIEEGATLGLSTSITGYKPFASFMKRLVKAGMRDATVTVRVKHSPRKNSANQEYGVCEFELLAD